MSSSSPSPPKPPAAMDVDVVVEHAGDLASTSGGRSGATRPRRCMELRRLMAAVSAALSSKPGAYWALLLLSSALTFASLVASSILPRSYYRHASTGSFWVISWFTTAGWPLAALLLLPFLLPSPSRAFLAPTLLLWCALLGLLTAISNSLFVGIYYLPWGWEMRGGTEATPVSSFHGATTAAFGALLGRCVAKNRVGAWKVNAAFLAAVAALAVAFEFSSREESAAASFVTAILILDVPVSVLRALVLALTERAVRRRTRAGAGEEAATPAASVRASLEVQAMVSVFAFAFSCIGFFADGGFAKVRSEGRKFEGGERSYHKILLWSAVAFQLLAVGGATLVGLSSTTFAGLLGSVRLPVTGLLAMAFFPDPMSALKIVGVVLGAWAVGSYGFGNLEL